MGNITKTPIDVFIYIPRGYRLYEKMSINLNNIQKRYLKSILQILKTEGYVELNPDKIDNLNDSKQIYEMIEKNIIPIFEELKLTNIEYHNDTIYYINDVNGTDIKNKIENIKQLVNPQPSIFKYGKRPE